jgi:ATP dependent DNA ligase domain
LGEPAPSGPIEPHVCRRVEAFTPEPPLRPPRRQARALSRVHRALRPDLARARPRGSDWLHEIKIDGYRAQLHIHDGRVRVFSRSGYDWTEQFSQIARAAEALSARELIIDGEATVVGKTGLPDFQALRRELAKKHTDRLIYMAFDLLYLDGHDLRGGFSYACVPDCKATISHKFPAMSLRQLGVKSS